MKKIKPFWKKLWKKAATGLKKFFAEETAKDGWAKKQIAEMARLGGRLVL
ncbi:MAG: hypothetical protein ABH867_01790 [Patescibacteria group bacterium]|nr:hypothetical protein [Patescibacteria group bacterium]